MHAEAAPTPDDQPIIALDLPPAPLSQAMAPYFAKCEEKLGFVPNVLAAYAFDMPKLEAFAAMYNDLMLAPSGLSKLEREMIAVAVSAVNRCYYCLVAHGAAVRALSGDPILGEQMVMNYRAARLPKRQRAMLDFATKLTAEPWAIGTTTATRCARPASPSATSGTFPPSSASSTCRTASPRRPTCGRTRCTTGRRGNLVVHESLAKVASGSYLADMRAVGLKILKNKLSEYVRLAASGETVLVTDRDRVVAEIIPPRADRSPAAR